MKKFLLATAMTTLLLSPAVAQDVAATPPYVTMNVLLYDPAVTRKLQVDDGVCMHVAQNVMHTMGLENISLGDGSNLHTMWGDKYGIQFAVWCQLSNHIAILVVSGSDGDTVEKLTAVFYQTWNNH